MLRRILLPALLLGTLLTSVASKTLDGDTGQRRRAQRKRAGAAKTPSARQTKGAKDESPAKVEQAERVRVRELSGASLAEVLRRDPAKNRPLLVNFWATWCDPCREEFPDLVKIDEEFHPRGLEFVTISLDDVDEINRSVPDFLVKMRAVRPPAYLLNADDPEAAILSVDKDWRGELPATFLFDGEGKLVFKHMGRIKPAELRAAIETVTSKTVTSDK